MSHDNIKSHKKPGRYPLSGNTAWEKIQEGQIDPYAFLRLNKNNRIVYVSISLKCSIITVILLM